MSSLQEEVTRFDASLEVVWENTPDHSGPRAIVRDRTSGRLYHWPALRAWIGEIPAMWRAAADVPCEIQTVRRDEPLRRDHAQRREANQLRLF
jgi:hypothetical protein